MNDEPVVACLGMGVDSIGIFTRWILEPHTRDFPLKNLICLTAMTGDEYDATRRLMETHILPLMRQHSIRYVQLARAGQSDDAGYDVLDDSRAPQRMYMTGRWRLSDELWAAGTVPTYSHGKRWCSWRAKGQQLDRWRKDEFPGAHYKHVIGFSAEETFRMERDSSYEDTSRTGSVRMPWYPLADWAWTRDVTSGYLHEVFGEQWSRSCCVYCPYQNAKAGRAEMVARWRAEPHAAARALLIEHRALALNANITLFSAGAAVTVAETYGLVKVLAAFRDLLEETRWALYDVRRIHRPRTDDPTRRGLVWRSVTRLASGSRAQMCAELSHRATGVGAEVHVDRHDIVRATVIEPEGDRYPQLEQRYVVGPDGVADKERAKFAEEWHQLIEQDARLVVAV